MAPTLDLLLTSRVDAENKFSITEAFAIAKRSR